MSKWSRKNLTGLLLLLALWICTGCYTEHTVDTSVLDQVSEASEGSRTITVRDKGGEKVRIKNPSETSVVVSTDRATKTFDAPFDTRVLETKLEVSGDSGKTIFSRDEISSVRIRTVDMTRSILLSSGIGASAGFVFGLLVL